MNILSILLVALSLQPGNWQTRGRIQTAPCTYRSVDQHGDSLTLSGRIWMPVSGQAERILVCPHYTITGNSECPSEGKPFESRLADERYVLIMPDYIGYGATVDRPHPYLDNELTVRNTLDMLTATRQWLEENDRSPVSDSIVIVGFSQGAAVAVGALCAIEQNNICPVRKCYASSGPYDVATTFDHCVEKDYVEMAYVIPAFVFGTAAAYDIEIHPEEIFTPWMLSHYDYALNKKHGVLASVLHLGRGKVSKYMTPVGMDKNQGDQKQLYQGYLRSSFVHMHNGDTLVNNWCPRTPIYLMHSENDDLVCFECAQNLRTMLERNGATTVEYDFGRYGSHLSSMLRFFRILKKEL